MGLLLESGGYLLTEGNPIAVEGMALLLENGSYLLAESGSLIDLEVVQDGSTAQT